MKHYLTALFAIILGIAMAKAQFPTGGNFNFGGNLFSPGGGGSSQSSNFHAPEGWIPDSVPLRIAKFKTDLLGFYTRDSIDTSFFHFEILRPSEHFNDVWIGNNTSPWLANSIDQRIQNYYPDFYYLNGFMDRIYMPQNNFYFRTNRPFTDLYYATSPKLTEQQTINVIHTQNVNYYTNFGLLFNSYTSIEPVTGDNSAVSSLVFWLATEKEKYRYNAVGFINSIRLLENGGIIDTTEYFNPESPQYFLTTGCKNKVALRGFSFNPEVLIRKTEQSKLTAQTYLLFARHTRNYMDPEPTRHPDYYASYYLDSNKVFDSVSYDLTMTELNLKHITAKSRKVVAIGYEYQSFYYFINYIFKQRGTRFSNVYLRSGWKWQKDKLGLDLAGKFYVLGRKKSQFWLHSQVSWAGDKAQLGFQSNFAYRTPSFFQYIYTGNVARWYNPQFVNELLWQNRAFFGLKSKKLWAELQLWVIKNYINFVDGKPFQHQELSQVALARIKSQLKLWFMHLDNTVTLQYSPQNYIFNLPLVMSFSSFWVDFYMFKKALKVNSGIDVYWTSPFYQYNYQPQIMAFFFYPSSPMAGIYPIANLFINFKVKRATIFVKLDYFNAYFDPIPYYSTTRHYHYPEFYLRYGVRWWFKN